MHGSNSQPTSQKVSRPLGKHRLPATLLASPLPPRLQFNLITNTLGQR